MKNYININPSDPYMSTENKRFLKKLLFDQPDCRILAPGNIYSLCLDNDPHNYEIEVTHTCVRRGNKGRYRFEVYGDPLPKGNGSSGLVHKILKTIKLTTNGEMIIKTHAPNKTRVLKHMLCDTQLPPEKWPINKEFNLLRRLSIFRAKQPVFTPRGLDRNDGYLIEHEFIGMDLFQLIKNSGRDPSDLKYIPLSADDRLLISIRILTFLLKLHRHHIVHNDLKPENIIVNPANLSVAIIDMDLSASKEEDVSGKCFGTPGFFSPEALNMTGPNLSSDVFSMARVLAELWGADLHELSQSQYDFIPLQFTAYFCHFLNLFKNISEFKIQHQSRVTDLLVAMTKMNPINRCSAAHALNVLQSIRLERAMETVMPEQHDEVAHAHKQATIIRDYSLERDRLTVAKEAIESVKDSKPAVKEFLATLDIKEWFHFDSIKEVKTAICNLIIDFRLNLLALIHLQPDIANEEQKRGVKDLLDRINAYPLTLNEIFEYAKIMNKKKKNIVISNHQPASISNTI